MSGSTPSPADTAPTADGRAGALLAIDDLRVEIDADGRRIYPLQGVSLDVGRAERVGMVGESGSGKSLTAAAILGLLPDTAVVTGGRILFDGLDLVGCDERRLQRIRGRRVSIVFQNPRASLNPVLTVGSQIAEVVRVHEGAGRRESWIRAVDLLDSMGMPDASRRARDYAHHYSGGMAQRAALALALACRPELLIADEPTSGLDATLQQQVLELVVEQVAARDASLLLITHDIGVVAETCGHVAVMYGGRIMEFGRTDQVLEQPVNPYTVKLVESFTSVEDGRMSSIPGVVRPPLAPLTGCPFTGRCYLEREECNHVVPGLRTVQGRGVACIQV